MTGGKSSKDLEAFRKIYLEYARALLAVAEFRLESTRNKTIARSVVEFTKESWRHVDTQELNAHQLIPSFEDLDFPSAIADKCAKEFFARRIISDYQMYDDKGRKITNPSFRKVRLHILIELKQPIKHLVRNNKLKYTNKEINKCLDKYLEFWKTKHIEKENFAPIYNISTDIKRIVLSKHLSISIFQPEEKSKIYNNLYEIAEALSLRELAQSNRVIRWTTGVNHTKEADELKRSTISCAITAFRLLKSGNIGTPGILSSPLLTHSLGSGRQPMDEFDTRKHWFPRDPYVFEQKDRGCSP